MKAVKVTAQDGALVIAPLALPTIHRKGDVGADNYRQQAKGEVKVQTYFASQAADVMRAIVLSEGNFRGLASQPGSLLNVVISGDLTLVAGLGQSTKLESGDVFLVDGTSAPLVTLDVREDGRLVQIAVSPEWPGTEAQIQGPGTIRPRPGAEPKLKRVVRGQGDDDKAYFAELTELFPRTPDHWSAPVPLSGFRMMCWEDGWMDYHPSPANQMGIIQSGEMEIEVGGGAGAKNVFCAGDICTSEDRTGQGHITRARGAVHTTNLVFSTENVWQK